jgi:NAD(P)-dependent dehydrogenase (short-subunit alcohol dehydrogenase family)
MNEIRFDERVVLVTGAGRGLGAAYARAFAERGASVVVHDAGVERDGSGGDPAVADAVVAEIAAVGGTAIAAYDNLEDECAGLRLVELAVGHFGRLDAVVHNAGLVIWAEIEVADAGWKRMRRIGIDAPFHITRTAFPVMREQGFGRFVFTTSGRAMAVERTRPGLAAYAAAKMAAFGLMIVTAAAGEQHGIRANAVSPAAATRVLVREVLPGELEPEQVVPGVLFLASDQCGFSGKVLEAAGGEFDVARWVSSDEVSFGRDPVAPEVIREQWHEIEGAVRA